MTVDAQGLISTSYDIEEPDPDFEFDPIGWFESTGEDIGLPPGWLDNFNRLLAESKAAREAKEEKACE
jgi:hypothetical protein